MQNPSKEEPHEDYLVDIPPLGFAIQRQTSARDCITPGTAMQETNQHQGSPVRVEAATAGSAAHVWLTVSGVADKQSYLALPMSALPDKWSYPALPVLGAADK